MGLHLSSLRAFRAAPNGSCFVWTVSRACLQGESHTLTYADKLQSHWHRFENNQGGVESFVGVRGFSTQRARRQSRGRNERRVASCYPVERQRKTRGRLSGPSASRQLPTNVTAAKKRSKKIIYQVCLRMQETFKPHSTLFFASIQNPPAN